MQFQYILEIVAVFILGLFLFDFLRIKKITKSSSSILYLLSITALLVTALGLSLMCFENGIVVPALTKKIITVCFYCFDGLAYYLTFLYILSFCGKLRSNFFLHFLFILPFLANTVLCIVTPILELDLYCNISSLLTPFNVYSLYFAVFASIYSVVGILYALYNKKRLKKIEVFTVLIFSFINLGCFAVQVINNYLILVSIARAITVGMIYLLIEHPAENVDSETGHFNKNALVGLLYSKIQLKKKFSLIHINIDKFHIITNLFGYEKSNLLLREICRTLDSVKASGLLFRLEKDTIVIFDSKRKEDETIKSIQERFNQPWIINDTEIQLSAAVVCAHCPSDFTTVSQGLELLTYLSKHAKTVGNQDVNQSTPSLIEDFNRLKQVEIAVKKAIEKKSFDIYFQPIHEAKTGKLHAAEVLVRLNDEKLGFVPPMEFIELAEKNGSIVHIGEIVFEKTCEFIAKYIKTKVINLSTIEINLSSVQCMHPDLADRFIAIMKKYEINPKWVNLELTETAVTNSESLVLAHMNKLKKLGVTFSCDDYGTGYSTCSYLLKFPFSQVKFDHSLTRAYFKNPNAKIIMDNEIRTIKDLGFTIVAEGIETDEQLRTFANLGVQYIQGYYFSKPLSENEFLVYHKAHELNISTFMSEPQTTSVKKTTAKDTKVTASTSDTDVASFTKDTTKKTSKCAVAKTNIITLKEAITSRKAKKDA